MDTSAFQLWLRLIKTTAIFFGVLLTFFAFIEVARAYVFLREISPWLGYAFLVALIGGLLWLTGGFLNAFLRLPRAPAPPEVADPDNLTPAEAMACAGYLQHRIKQFIKNPRLPAADHQLLEETHIQLSKSTSQPVIQRSRDDLNRILAPLDQAAEKMVQNCVRDVMAAVVLSPFRSADLLVVLYRNGQMILQLAQHYQTQPTLSEQLRIFRDVLAIVATVNFLNFTEKFLEQLFQGIPIIGTVAGDLSQGVGAGLLTSATGHAAIQRCKCIDPWNRVAAQKGLVKRMPQFARDLKAIVSSDVLPKLLPRMPDSKSVSDRVLMAFDATINGMGAWVWRPVATRGSAFASATVRGGASAWHGLRSGTQGMAKRLNVFGKMRHKNAPGKD